MRKAGTRTTLELNATESSRNETLLSDNVAEVFRFNEARYALVIEPFPCMAIVLQELG